MANKLKTAAPPHSDIGVADAFAERCALVRRYVSKENLWYVWTGQRWQPDDLLTTQAAVAALCSELSNYETTAKAALDMASVQTVSAVERLARFDHRLVASVDHWDRDDLLLNTPGGTIDLRRSGPPVGHRFQDYITRITAIAPSDAGHPLWTATLDRVLPDHQAQVFLQRFAGYSLSGDTSAHGVLFCYGTGANGKTVVINTLRGILGSYATVAATETFMGGAGDRHPTEIAGLKGFRLVTANETEEGRRWNQSRLAELTGGGPVSARFMRGDFFEFVPKFKLVISSNHRPALRGVNEAIRRRLHLLHFAVTIPESERDPHLEEKLRAEWPAILRWCLDGHALFRERGLQPPASVKAATEDYMSSEDARSRWIDEACERDAGAWTSSKDLFASWCAFARAEGEYLGSQKKLSYDLQDLGFKRAMNKERTARGWLGIRLRPSSQEEMI